MVTQNDIVTFRDISQLCPEEQRGSETLGADLLHRAAFPSRVAKRSAVTWRVWSQRGEGKRRRSQRQAELLARDKSFQRKKTTLEWAPPSSHLSHPLSLPWRSGDDTFPLKQSPVSPTAVARRPSQPVPAAGEPPFHWLPPGGTFSTEERSARIEFLSART